MFNLDNQYQHKVAKKSFSNTLSPIFEKLHNELSSLSSSGIFFSFKYTLWWCQRTSTHSYWLTCWYTCAILINTVVIWLSRKCEQGRCSVTNKMRIFISIGSSYVLVLISFSGRKQIQGNLTTTAIRRKFIMTNLMISTMKSKSKNHY